jgi:hypothetical protein
MINNPEITVDKANQLPHGTVKRAPEGFAHAILLDQMGQDLKWHIIDLYGPMETETDRDVADWPIVYVPAPDEVWMAMNRQPSYRDHVIEEFASSDACEPVDLTPSGQQPLTGMEALTYPRSGFVVPCKNCDHKQWIHDQDTGECYGRVEVPGASCGCSGFEEVPEVEGQEGT